ncbi:hypothetical protein FHS15_003554 [Paenibacillus castaneae]|uniref:DUF4097 family beta strand repeat-containing protein n=1 Tax=Paenibacillus castaneae TaxID=474957 RepID=UPI000C9A9085|nr:DUF4097 family beta strand repeat-containing protein [Paenibacillus castaneae]NIK78416.1 hypothetical protein [Paenibacillus castaneae]
MKKLVAIALIMLGIGIICSFFVFGESDMTKFKGEAYLQEKTVDASSVKSIHAETDTFNLTFVRGSTEDIQIRLEGSASEKNINKIIFKAEQKGDTLYITGNTKKQFMIGISIINLKMTVELPEKLWESFDIETDTGNISVDQLKTEKIKVKSDTGNVKINDYTVEQFVFETDTGNVTLTDGSGSLKGKTDTGNIRIEAEQLLRDITLQSDTGNISINVDKQPQSATIRIKNDVGNNKVEWDGFMNHSNSKRNIDGIIGSGELKIDIKSDVGNIKLGNR